MTYLFTRLLQGVVVFFGTSLLVFLAVFALPGDPLGALAGDAELSETVVRNLEARYHLDQPVLVQYWYYITGLLQGDFGTTVTGENVSDIFAHAWPVTIQLALTAWVLELIIGVTLGIVAALRPGGIADRMATSVAILALAIPTFVLAFFLQQWFGLSLGWFPVAGVSAGWPLAYLLPAFCIAMLGVGPIARLMRTSLLETVSADYVRTAKARGISPLRLSGRHVFRNALVPVVTYLGVDLGALLGGAVVVEGIFNLPGIGRALFTAINTQQGSVVVGIVTAGVLVVLVMNILVDIAHKLLDPRIAP
ncbi:ABC transporter permease [Microbacterium esteraromaticum]|uniref:ABC transporter permease n=1 Tax=Microbacterium esteraromaticum TaxID=57043 RepID=A0A939IVW7_9MICO|nr:ABC transporter permease [Microbacterium esteraromaticum]MBN7794787.1 ABC transporter permease [Microbacterium esteraromaticum]MBN8206871.1 ABC transporter permease [Microbacterium esteraromaticum]MBN8417026.1 ABC transporter permease [Microbacterium esteraromaticum]MBY6062415.1 ABC transporter permease [Microbacterium esteraromaticum]MCA1307411.1 ABC transporter permease [Microbacterium esteraromaticum]